MNKMTKSKALLAIVLSLTVIACTTTQVSTAYKIDATTTTVVDTAMQSYGNLFRAGLISPTVEVEVQKGYGIYQQVMLANINATQALVALQAMSSPDPVKVAQAQAVANTALANCSAAVMNLFLSLQKGGVNPNVLSPVLNPPLK